VAATIRFKAARAIAPLLCFLAANAEVENALYIPSSLGCPFAAGGVVYVLMKNVDRWEMTEAAQLYTAD